MTEPAYRIRGVGLPDGDEVGWWTSNGTLTDRPVDGADELPGRYVVPGLVDAHCHLTLAPGDAGPQPADADQPARLLAAMARDGVLALRDTGAHDDSAVRLSAADRGEVVVIACGRFLAPPGGYFPGVYTGVPAEAVAAAAVAEIRSGATWVKVVGDFPPAGDLTRPPETNYDRATLQRLVDAVHAAGGRVAVHVTTGVVADVVATGVDSVEHGTALTEDTVRAMAARGTAWTPTLGAVLRPVPLGAPPEWAQRRQDRIDLMRSLLPLALRHGVPILTGSDVVGTVVQEVALLAELGVPPEAALAAATTSARRFLGLPALAAGAPADLVTYDDDPRADPTVLARPAAVLSRGRRLR